MYFIELPSGDIINLANVLLITKGVDNSLIIKFESSSYTIKDNEDIYFLKNYLEKIKIK